MKIQDKLSNKIVGYVGTILGGVFVVAGIVLFVLLNAVNMYSQKTVATIMSRTDVKTDEPYVFLDLAYRVGDEMVYTTQSFKQTIPEEQVEIDVYYNIKDPKTLEDGGWNFQPIGIFIIGIMIGFVGIYYIKTAADGIDGRKDKSKNNLEQKYDKVKDRLESDVVMLMGSMSLLIFGIILKINVHSFWPWIIIGTGGIATVYILIDTIPVAKEFFDLKSVQSVNQKSFSIDDDFEKFEKEQASKKKLKKNEIDDFEVEDTYEIKNINNKPRKKK